MAVSRYFYKKLENGSMSSEPTHLGAKAEHVTIQPAIGEELLNAQSEFERMWQVDTDLNNKIDKEITDREQAITNEAAARSNADTILQNNIDAEAEARTNADKAEFEARTAAIAAEEQAREDKDNTILEALSQEIADRQNKINEAIGQEVSDRNTAINDAIAALDLKNQFDALKEKLLYTADTEAAAITEDIVLNLSEAVYTYILIYCEYNGKRMPVYQVLADGAGSEIVYHSLTEDGICYVGMNILVSENTLAISNVINSNVTAEFKILNIYGCV